jgi:heme/copper-type cytochrome/quinol oxidase subunit 2
LGGETLHFLVLRRKTVTTIFILICCLTVFSFWLASNPSEITAFNQQKNTVRDIHIVTGEFYGKNAVGKEIEAYRWDSGTIIVQKGERVRLNILGISGKEHPFIIEGTNIKGTVKQGEETIVPIQFDEEGVYRLICLTHPDKLHNGPMIAYIIVD